MFVIGMLRRVGLCYYYYCYTKQRRKRTSSTCRPKLVPVETESTLADAILAL